MARSDARKLPVATVDRRPGLVPPEYSDAATLLVTFGFHCNLACVFCMVEDVLGAYRGADLPALRAFLADREAMSGIRRVTLSGGEATLERDLVDYVQAARSAPGVQHVRVQTNGTRLAHGDLLARLVDAGVDEVFVSIHGPDEDTCDRITGRRGSFREIMAGLEAVAASRATLVTNTVICAPNHRRLGEIVDRVAPLRPAACELWNLWPRIDKGDARGLFVRVGEARPHVVEALRRCEAHRVVPVVKWFPHCLLGPYARYHDDSQPTVLIEQRYWEAAPEFACIYQGVCAHAPDACAGLSFPYIHKLGWEEEVLEPARREGPPRSLHDEDRSAEDAGGGAVDDAIAAELAGIDAGVELGGFQLRSRRVDEGSALLTLVRGGDELRVRVYPTRPDRRAYARTATLDLVHDRVEPRLEPLIQAPLQALLARLAPAGFRRS
jgi:MoaA/NifB/PqqE/SkfB family radical SAM enzyme